MSSPQASLSCFVPWIRNIQSSKLPSFEGMSPKEARSGVASAMVLAHFGFAPALEREHFGKFPPKPRPGTFEQKENLNGPTLGGDGI
jgi:hypothetical protein